MMASSPYREFHLEQDEEAKHPAAFHKRKLEIVDTQEQAIEEDEFTKLQKLSEQAATQQRIHNQESNTSSDQIRMDNTQQEPPPTNTVNTFPFHWGSPSSIFAQQDQQQIGSSPIMSSSPEQVSIGNQPQQHQSTTQQQQQQSQQGTTTTTGVTYLPVKNIFDPATYATSSSLVTTPTDRSSRNIAYLCTRIAEELKVRPQTRDELSAATGFARQRICTVISVFRSIGLVNIRDSNTRRSEIEWNADQAKMFPDISNYTKQILSIRSSNRSLKQREEELLQKLKSKSGLISSSTDDQQKEEGIFDLVGSTSSSSNQAQQQQQQPVEGDTEIKQSGGYQGMDILEKSSSTEKIDIIPAPFMDKIPILVSSDHHNHNHNQNDENTGDHHGNSSGQGDEGFTAQLLDTVTIGKNQSGKR